MADIGSEGYLVDKNAIIGRKGAVGLVLVVQDCASTFSRLSGTVSGPHKVLVV